MRSRLAIGYRITGDQLQGQVGVACRTETTQVLTILLWSGRRDACSCRLLAETLRTAARSDLPARLPVFAKAARELFRHAVLTLPFHPANCTRRHRAACPACHRPLDDDAPKADCEAPPLPADLLAAIDDLGSVARHQPRVTLTPSAGIDPLTRATLPALHGLFATIGIYLEHTLQPLGPHVIRDAVRALILETRRELDDLAARPMDGVYLEALTIAAADDKTVNLEVEGSLGVPEP